MLELNSENFESEAIGSKEPVIVDFWAPWCPPCRMMAPVFEELSNDYVGRLRFAKLNTEESPEFAQKFAITSIPSLVIIKNGKEIDRIVGFVPKDDLKQKIDVILSKI